MPEIDKSTLEELSRFFAPAYIREEVEKLRGWQHQLALDTSFGRVISTPTWISGVSIQNNTVDADKLNVGELKAITAYTGSLVVSGANKDTTGGQLTIAANVDQPLVNSITFRAVDDAYNAAGITFRNASGTKTVEMKLDGSGKIGANTAITWDANGNVAIPISLIAGGITISNVTSGRIGGNYDLYASGDTTSSNFIRLDPTQGIGIFGPTQTINWNNAKTHLRLDGSAKFTAGIEILTTYSDARLKLNATDGIVFEQVSTGVKKFSLNPSGVLRIRQAVIGSTGTPGSGARIEISDSEIAGYGTSGSTFRLGVDGSGYIKAGNSTNQAIQWSNAGVTINASAITTGTLNVANLTVENLKIMDVGGGTFGGSYEPTSENVLVWTKHSSGKPLSFISPDQLWVETTSNQARFAQTIRNTAGEITNACSIDIVQSLDPGPPANYWGRMRLRYSSDFYDGPYIEFQYVPTTAYGHVKLISGTTQLAVKDNEITLNKALSAQGATFIGNINVSSETRCSILKPYGAATVLYIALPANGQFQVRDNTNTIRGGWKSDGTPIFNGPNSTTAGSQLGYIHIELGGHTRKIPYYS